jgi:hypothetical protein
VRKMSLILSLLVFSLILVGDAVLASTINVNGAGSSFIDGVYSESVMLGGRPSYRKEGTYYLILWDNNDSNRWEIYNFNNSRTYYYNPNDLPFPSQIGWLKGIYGLDNPPALSGNGTYEGSLPVTTPEPSMMVLLGLSLIGLIGTVKILK